MADTAWQGDKKVVHAVFDWEAESGVKDNINSER